MTRLRERQVEFAVMRLLSPQLDADLATEPLFHKRVFIAAGPANRYAERRKIALRFGIEPWILAPPEIGKVRRSSKRSGPSAAMPPTTVLGLSLPLRNGLLATGRFLTIVPGSIMKFGAERTL